jgi:hypothetical protein
MDKDVELIKYDHVDLFDEGKRIAATVGNWLDRIERTDDIDRVALLDAYRLFKQGFEKSVRVFTSDTR